MKKQSTTQATRPGHAATILAIVSMSLSALALLSARTWKPLAAQPQQTPVACALGIQDRASTNCIGASSAPAAGSLLPLGSFFYVDNSGNVGIGTTAPVEKLDVQGVVHSLAGGFMFPDGTMQATANPPELPAVVTGIAQAPDSPGLQSITGVGFQPTLVRITCLVGQRDNTFFSTSIGVGTGPQSQNVICQGMPSNNQTFVVTSQTEIVIIQDGPTLSKAALLSMDPDGFTLEWTIADEFQHFLWEAYR